MARDTSLFRKMAFMELRQNIVAPGPGHLSSPFDQFLIAPNRLDLAQPGIDSLADGVQNESLVGGHPQNEVKRDSAHNPSGHCLTVDVGKVF
jgi:hypothetical protein